MAYLNEGCRRRLTPQGQVDRFLYLPHQVYRLPADYRKANHQWVATALLTLKDNWEEYVGMEEGEGVEWELEDKIEQ